MSEVAASWSTLFVGSLEAIGFGPRRSRRGAGEVLSLSLSTSLAIALFRSPDPEPYRARIAVRAFDPAQWRRIEQELAGQALHAARLLAGELPVSLADTFGALGLPLFPATTRDIAMDCTCPDWQVPCGHLSTACWLLAEMFDSDPFQVLAWRGRTRTNLLERLVSVRATVNRPTGGSAHEPRPPAERLASFWGVGSVVPAVVTATGSGQVDSVRRPDLLLDQVPPPDLDIAGRPLVDLLRPLYRRITEDRTDRGRDRPAEVREPNT